jgi:hypothetical protein
MFFGRAAAAQRSRWQAVKQDKSTHTHGRANERKLINVPCRERRVSNGLSCQDMSVRQVRIWMPGGVVSRRELLLRVYASDGAGEQSSAYNNPTVAG